MNNLMTFGITLLVGLVILSLLYLFMIYHTVPQSQNIPKSTMPAPPTNQITNIPNTPPEFPKIPSDVNI